MPYKGSSVYDHENFLANYMKRRSRKDSPNNAIEDPIIFELLGDFKGKNVLDLGCGDASFGKALLNQGAENYLCIEGSEKMVALAQNNLAGLNGLIYHATMENFHFPENEFDVITSRFAIHYVSNIQVLFHNVYNSLKKDGKFVFSVQHPLTTSSFISKQSGDKRENWIVDDYFHEGERKEPWIDEVVVKYHRTIEHYFSTLTKAGFIVNELREGNPVQKNFTSEEEYIRRQRIPVMLVFSCTVGKN